MPLGLFFIIFFLTAAVLLATAGVLSFAVDAGTAAFLFLGGAGLAAITSAWFGFRYRVIDRPIGFRTTATTYGAGILVCLLASFLAMFGHWMTFPDYRGLALLYPLNAGFLCLGMIVKYYDAKAM